MMGRQDSFHPFLRLPSELRLKIWHLTVFPRLVSITANPLSNWEAQTEEIELDEPNDATVTFDPRNCPPDCTSHAHRSPRERVPTILHVCRESRHEGLKIYTPFSAGKFEGGYLNLGLDTIHHARCHHETPGGYQIRGNPRGPFSQWEEERSVIGSMALVSEEVEAIRSLALCCCQMRGVNKAPNFNSFMAVLKKFINLKELLFVQLGSKDFVAKLRESEEELGPADDGTWEAVGGRSRMRSVRNNSPRGRMWIHMVQVWQLKERLEEALMESEDEWEHPQIRCVVISDDKIAWEQEFGHNVRKRVEELR